MDNIFLAFSSLFSSIKTWLKNHSIILGSGASVGIATNSPVVRLDVATGMMRVGGRETVTTGEGLEVGWDTYYNTGVIMPYDRENDTPGNKTATVSVSLKLSQSSLLRTSR